MTRDEVRSALEHWRSVNSAIHRAIESESLTRVDILRWQSTGWLAPAAATPLFRLAEVLEHERSRSRTARTDSDL